MAVLVVGASSQIGYFVLQRLAATGQAVLALSRYAHAGTDGVQWRQGQLPERMPEQAAFEAIICFGPQAALASWLASLQRAPAPRLVATSSMSAVSKQQSVVPAEVELARSLREGEAALARECERLGMAWTIIRPTLIYGAGLDKSLTPLARRAMRWRLFPLPAASGLRQPVHADDIADAALRALNTPGAWGRIFELGGGERISAETMFRRVRDSLPMRNLALPIGRWVQVLISSVLPFTRGPLSRLDTDLVADNAQIERVLGIAPRAFRPQACMWQLPAAVKRTQ